MLIYGLNEERMERLYPTPSEWTFLSRSAYRSAKAHEEPEAFERGVVDWVFTGNLYKQLVKRLENPKIDGEGLKKQEDGDHMMDGIGPMGLDVTSKSYPWRRGYYEALMGAAKGAENLDGFLRDDTRSIVFPPDVVLGPSNPNPRPCPPGTASAPLEKDCSPAFEPPQFYYMKILTTKGFITQERLRAALAYADWLDFKNLPDSAHEMYKWALDIATSTFEHPESVVDRSTGIIKADAPLMSPNTLLATTSLATHHARNADLTTALPIFLSILRARRSLPPAPASQLQPARNTSNQEGEGLLSGILSLLRPLFSPPPYPTPLPSGDEPALRTPASICSEAGLMANIGELLWASSSFDDGLKWTREAVDVAEKEYEHSQTDEEASERCAECLLVGIENWRKMLAKLARDQKDGGGKQLDLKERSKSSAGFSWWGGERRKMGEEERPDWIKEQLAVEERARRIQFLLGQERFKKSEGVAGSWLRSMMFV